MAEEIPYKEIVVTAKRPTDDAPIPYPVQPVRPWELKLLEEDEDWKVGYDPSIVYEPDFSLLTPQERKEGIPGLFTPEELALAREASHQWADQEMLADVYRRVDPSVHPGGELGILSALGQSRDGGARYKGISVGPGDSYVRGQLGSYYPEKGNPVDEEGVLYSGQGYPLASQLLMEQGMDPLRPGEIFFQQSYGDIQNPFLNFTREEIENPAGTLLHEFFHRGLDAPWYPEFVDWVEQVEADQPYSTHLTHVRSPLTSRRREESFAGTISDLAWGKEPKKIDELNQTTLLKIDEALRAFFTPERQEKYGIRLPLKATVPEYEDSSILDRIIETATSTKDYVMDTLFGEEEEVHGRR